VGIKVSEMTSVTGRAPAQMMNVGCSNAWRDRSPGNCGEEEVKQLN